MNNNKILLKKYLFPLIMTILTFLIGCYMTYCTIGNDIIGIIIVLLINFIPSILFFINTMIIIKNNMNSLIVKLINILTIITTLGLLFYYLVALIIVSFTMVIHPVSSPMCYKRFLRVYASDEAKKIFPNQIDKNMKNVKFHYNPEVLQGGEVLYLYYIDTNMSIEKIDKKYKDKAIWVGNKANFNETNNDKKGLLSGSIDQLPLKNNYDAADENDFVIYLIRGKCDDSGYCNHGTFLLVAFNEKTKEIIYREENW